MILAMERRWHEFAARRAAWLVGIGAIAAAATAILSPAQFFRAYLVADLFLLGLPLGALALLMIHALTGGEWGQRLRPGLDAAARTLPLTLLASAPLLVGFAWVYPWTNGLADVEHQRWYFGVPFFLGRAVAYGLIWLGVAATFQRCKRPESRQRASAAGLILYSLTITFASIDWVMSLDPRWASTIFPVLVAVSQGLQAAAFAVLLCVLVSPTTIPNADLRDLGNLLLMFVMLWAYLSFSQYLLVWSANLPEEIPWYLRRLRGGWEWIAAALVVFSFALPFALLLMRAVKHRSEALAAVCALILAMRFVDVVWWVEASAVHAHAAFAIADLGLLALLGGAWTLEFRRQFRDRNAEAAK